jgi:hypothetical protein
MRSFWSMNAPQSIEMGPGFAAQYETMSARDPMPIFRLLRPSYMKDWQGTGCESAELIPKPPSLSSLDERARGQAEEPGLAWNFD